VITFLQFLRRPSRAMTFFDILFETTSRSNFKTPSSVRVLRCRPLQNAHILTRMLRFFIGLRLALERDLRS
jgi:hypothetical protein